MINTGVWMLMIMIYGTHGLVLVPYDKYDSKVLCEMWKGRESLELGVPLTCVNEKGA